MLSSIRKAATAIVAIGALALGGAAIAGAADKTASPPSSSPGSGSSQTRPAPPQRDALSGDVAAKVNAAALDKVPGATVLRTEAGGPYGSPYHAHIRTSDGAQKVVLVDAAFKATAVEAEPARGRGGPGGAGGPGNHGGRGPGETALTGDTKDKVEAAVLAKYSGATIVRTETNGDSGAPYESHITTRAGEELEVLVSTDFEVLDAREHPARP